MTALSIDEINMLPIENNRIKKQNKELQTALNKLSSKYEQLQNTLKEVLSIAQRSKNVPCLNIRCDCGNCQDKLTNYGESCMLKGLAKIEELVEKCLENKKSDKNE